MRARRSLLGGYEVGGPLAFSGALDDCRGDQMLHRGLFMCNRRRLRPGTVSEATPAFREALRELATMQFLEGRIVEAARLAVREHAGEAPRELDGLLTWLEALLVTGPGQLDPLWDWIATEATQADLEWFVLQELVAETGSDDLAASVSGSSARMTAVERLRHTALLMGVEIPETAHAAEHISWQALGRSNLVTALGATERWHAHSVGALAAMLTVLPGRVALIEKALTRLGYEVYPSALPIERGAAGRMVARQLKASSEAASDIASGALMWMRAGVRCLDSYRARLMTDENPL